MKQKDNLMSNLMALHDEWSQGVTAHARSIQHTDERVKVESLAGKLMQTVA